MRALKLSRYAHVYEVPAGAVLFSARSGAVAELPKRTFSRVRRLLADLKDGRAPSASVASLVDQLIEGGFLVDRELDEIAAVESEYHAGRKDSQFLLTILPTFACNLACDYCFVGKKRGNMASTVQDHLIAFVTERLKARRPPSVNVDWFGGEPLVALPVLADLSRRLMRLSEQHAVPYRAQVITNGTLLSAEAVDTLLDCAVDRVQISIDGPQGIHDHRRPARAENVSSFDATMACLPNVIGRFVVRLRINVDDRNVGTIWQLLDLFQARGWLGPDSLFFPYLARVSPFTEACARAGSHTSEIGDFWETQLRWMSALRDAGVPIEDQGLYQFPEPRSYNCTAVGANGFVFTPDGEVHKCGLEVDDSARAAGRLGEPLDADSPPMRRFSEWSPFADPVCRECSHLPTCLGGCPRNRIDGRDAQNQENCTYYKRIEQNVLLFHLGHRAPNEASPKRERVHLPVVL